MEMAVVVIEPQILEEQMQEMDKKREKTLHVKQMVAEAHPKEINLQSVLRDSESKMISNLSYFISEFCPIRLLLVIIFPRCPVCYSIHF